MLLRNCVSIILAAMLYSALLYALQLLGAEGGLLLVFAFHIGFGVLGYFMFAGRNLIRALCVFVAVLIYGVAIEFLNPDPRHELVQVVVAVAFGLVAALSVSGGALLGNAFRQEFEYAFRPRWKHSDWRIRMEAIRSMDDLEVLGRVAGEDLDWHVRQSAVSRLTDCALLERITETESDEDVRTAANERLESLQGKGTGS